MSRHEGATYCAGADPIGVHSDIIHRCIKRQMVLTVPEGSPSAWTVTGGQPVPRLHCATTPSWHRPSTRSWIGRSRMRATPSNTNSPRPAAATAAVRGLQTERLQKFPSFIQLNMWGLPAPARVAVMGVPE